MFQINENIPAAEGAYIVGGSVRDMLLNRMPVDYDIAVRENPEKYARRVAANVNGRVVPIGKGEQTVFRIVSQGRIFDVAPINGASIEEDLLRRDFTVNAVAYALFSGNIIDVAGGRSDIAANCIRMVSPEAFGKDPLRLFRAFRLGACLEFAIEPDTLAAIRKNALLIGNVAGERIREELLRFLKAESSFPFLKLMADTGFLFALIPEMRPMKACSQNRYHRHDVFEHTMIAYDRLEALFSGADPFLSHLRKEPSGWLASADAPLLKWALLLHDLGKPASRSVDRAGSVHFYGHAKKGALAAAAICRRFRFSNRDKRFVDFIIRSHLRPLSLFPLHRADHSHRMPTTRFFTKCGNYAPFLLLHALADHQGKGGAESAGPFRGFIADLLDLYFVSYRPIRRSPPLISGHDLIDDFGLQPSPLFKKILGRVEEARLSGKINSRPEAYRMVKKLLAT